jgi:hypothetical protein
MRMVTDRHLTYKRKYQDPVTVPNNVRFVFTANEPYNPAWITPNTPLVTFRCSNEKIGDTQYFKAFAEYMSRDENKRAIMYHLGSIDL